jgi:predicted RNA binding protein YcfA (HicA-like mRNA interferase family)
MGVKFKSLSGRDLVSIFALYGFVAISQSGSHVKLRRISVSGSETLIIPSHNKLPKGTLRAIFGQATQYIPRVELHQHFYTSGQ